MCLYSGSTTSGAQRLPCLRYLITMLYDLRACGVKFRSLKEAMDTGTPDGPRHGQMIGVLAEFERSLIVERTRAGMKAANVGRATLYRAFTGTG